jgi:hypothetical protein
LLNFHDQELTFNTSVEILKQCAVEEQEKSEPEPNERTMAVLKLNKRFGLMEADNKVFDDIDWQQHQARSSNNLRYMRRFCRRRRGFFSADFRYR